jgi:hypothetical protein
MPITEYLLTFDKFLRGGQDCEFGLLALAAIFCLVLLLSHQRREGLSLLLSLQRILSSLFKPVDPASTSASHLIAAMRSRLLPDASLLIVNLPLQI